MSARVRLLQRAAGQTHCSWLQASCRTLLHAVAGCCCMVLLPGAACCYMLSRCGMLLHAARAHCCITSEPLPSAHREDVLLLRAQLRRLRLRLARHHLRVHAVHLPRALSSRVGVGRSLQQRRPACERQLAWCLTPACARMRMQACMCAARTRAASHCPRSTCCHACMHAICATLPPAAPAAAPSPNHLSSCSSSAPWPPASCRGSCPACPASCFAFGRASCASSVRVVGFGGGKCDGVCMQQQHQLKASAVDRLHTSKQQQEAPCRHTPAPWLSPSRADPCCSWRRSPAAVKGLLVGVGG